MAANTRRWRFETDHADEMTVVRFTDPLLDEQNCWIIRDQVRHLAEEARPRHLLLDFGNVKFLSSAALGALLALYHKTKTLGCRISLCHLAEEIEEVFRATKLDQVFDIHWRGQAPPGRTA